MLLRSIALNVFHNFVLAVCFPKACRFLLPMAFTCNVTFVVHQQQEEKLLDYIRIYLLPLLVNNQSPAKNPELKKVIEAGGERVGANHGLSIALSVWLNSEDDAFLWNDHILIPSLADFNDRFGNEALFFITLLKNIPV